jgi:hypothetical protein
MVYPLFEAPMAVDTDGALLVGWADNPNATTYSTTRAGLRLLRWTDAEGWSGTDEGVDVLYPMGPSVTVSGGKAWVAVAKSDTGGANDESNDPGRYTRHVGVYRVSLASDGAQAWTEVWRAFNAVCPADVRCDATTPTTDAEGHDFGRMEAPAIVAGDEGLLLGFVAYGDETGNTVLYTGSDRGGTTWSTPERLDSTGRVFGHVSPRWGEGWLYWTRLGTDDVAEVCRWQPDAAAEDCRDLDGARVNGLAPIAGGARVSVDRGVGQWEGVDVAFD